MYKQPENSVPPSRSDSTRRARDAGAALSAILFVVAGIWMLTIRAAESTIISDFIHAIGVFSIAMAAIPLLLRRR